MISIKVKYLRFLFSNPSRMGNLLSREYYNSEMSGIIHMINDMMKYEKKYANKPDKAPFYINGTKDIYETYYRR